jgi:2-hydroxychromene-2-carboxylate isomerase
VSFTRPASIEFHFDPACPWTWATSRWLVDAAEQAGITISWHSLSLGVLNEGREIPERYRAMQQAGTAAHRMIAALLADGRNDLVGDFYTEYGRRVHHDREGLSVDLVRAVAEAAGAGAWAAAIDEPSWDAAVRSSTEHAIALGGPEVGSPVLAFGDPIVGIFGPIVSPPPTGHLALRLLDLVLEIALVPSFFELKRGRVGGVELGPRP